MRIAVDLGVTVPWDSAE